MNLITYRCARGHKHQHEVSSGRGESDLPCDTDDCGLRMKRLIVERGEKHSWEIRKTRCHGCKITWSDVMVDRDAPPPACEECGGETEYVFEVGAVGRWSARTDFAHFNRGLGEHVTSPRDLREKAKRKGLVPLEEGWDRTMDNQLRAQDEIERANDAFCADYEERLAKSPKFRKWRESASKGAEGAEHQAALGRLEKEYSAS